MIDDAQDDLAHFLLFGFGFGHEIVVGGIEEEVSVELV